MQAILEHEGKSYRVDLSEPIDISIPLFEGEQGVNCFYAPFLESFPVKAGSFIGSTQEGGAVNFRNIRINPHGNGTHTECVGHISQEPFSIHDCLQSFHFFGNLVSVYPQRLPNGDRVILRSQLEACLEGSTKCSALILRTQPNEQEFKWHAHYSGTNPPYLEAEAAAWLAGLGIEHLLVDLPSVDREEDEGLLKAHKAFWKYPDNIRTHCTISELIYVNQNIPDGLYLVNIQIASFQIDVSPSKPVLYPLYPIDQ